MGARGGPGFLCATGPMDGSPSPLTPPGLARRGPACADATAPGLISEPLHRYDGPVRLADEDSDDAGRRGKKGKKARAAAAKAAAKAKGAGLAAAMAEVTVEDGGSSSDSEVGRRSRLAGCLCRRFFCVRSYS